MQTRLPFAILIVLTALAAGAQSPAQRLNALAEQTIDREFELNPISELFALGRGPNAGRAFVNATNEHAERQRALYRDVLARLKGIPREGLGESDGYTHEMLRLRAENEIARLEFPLRQIQLLMPGRGLHGGLIFLAAVSQPLETESDFETWLARIEATAKTAELTTAALEEARKAGWTATRIHAEKSLQQMESIASRAPEQGPLWAPMRRYPKSAGEDKRRNYERRYREALEQRDSR